MKTQPVISSLTIKKLFGEHDLRIDFSNLTVIVGKNGLGKTTILKIINGLITGKDLVDYSGICESIELIFGDGHSVCYGAVSENFMQTFAKTNMTEFMIENDNIKQQMKSTLEKWDILEGDVSDELVNSVIAAFAKNDNFINMTKSKIIEEFEKSKEIVIVDKVHRKKINDNISVRYISTVNISANAGNNMDFGNSIEKNLLDLAIYDELRLLLKNGSDPAISLFISQLNIFLTESGKTIKRDHGEWMFITGSGQSLRLEQLSSGERQLVYVLATAANTCGKSTLFLMDEPEVSLHLSWQEKIIDAIMNINPEMQIIAVTHSPGIIMNGHMDAYVEMKDIMQDSKNA